MAHKRISLAYFISPHGYGHATRASAVMEAILRRAPHIHFHIFTKAPRFLFDDCIPGCFSYHSVLTDVGLVQLSPMEEDIPATIKSLNKLLPFRKRLVSDLAAQVGKAGCRLVLCDIAPLGIAVAREAGLPSVLIENFTWDWIYHGYARANPGMQTHVEYLKNAFGSATMRIQTEPVCRRSRTLVVPPVSRMPRRSRLHVRRQLGIKKSEKLIMISMGGIPAQHGFLEKLGGRKGVRVLVPGGSGRIKRTGNLILLPHHSRYYHPDLAHACDAIISKVGYSILSETYAAGIPYGFVSRPKFRESKFLVRFVRREMQGIGFTSRQFDSGAWIDRLEELLALPRVKRAGPRGADLAAGRVLSMIG